MLAMASSSIQALWPTAGARAGFEGSQTQTHRKPLYLNTPCVAPTCNFRSAAVRTSNRAIVSGSKHEKFSITRDLSSSMWGDLTKLHRSRSARSATCSTCGGAMPLVRARLFGPAIFEASKLKVLFLGKEDGKDENAQLQQPRIYTLTHSDTTAKITLAVAQEINKAQLKGWYSRLQRDEVLAEWRKTQGKMALHVHCHISGGNWLHNLIAKLRFYIFRKELPVVLEAFMHGDKELFVKNPELRNAQVWVYFHSNMAEYNRLESWGPLCEATKGAYASELQQEAIHQAINEIVRAKKRPGTVCTPGPCACCSTHAAVIPVPDSFASLKCEGGVCVADSEENDQEG